MQGREEKSACGGMRRGPLLRSTPCHDAAIAACFMAEHPLEYFAPRALDVGPIGGPDPDASCRAEVTWEDEGGSVPPEEKTLRRRGRCNANHSRATTGTASHALAGQPGLSCKFGAIAPISPGADLSHSPAAAIATRGGPQRSSAAGKPTAESFSVPELGSGTESEPGAVEWGALLFLVFAMALVAMMLAVAGCQRKGAAAAVTQFAPPTTAPSVTPAASAAAESNDAAGQLAGDARGRAARLTPENLPAEKLGLLDVLDRLAGAIQATGGKLATAVAAAQANDAAVKSIAAERDQARAMVGEREKTIADKDRELAQAKSGEHKAQVMAASVAIGAAVFVGVLELGAGWVVAAILGAIAFALCPFVVDAIQPWIKWGLLAAVVAAGLFAKEAMEKGGVLAAVHDRFSPADKTEGKVAA